MRRVTMLGAALVLTAGALAVGPAPAGAVEASFQAVAAGDGVRVTWTVPNAPLSDNVADFGGPVAQAVLDSIGESSAYASFPNPGAGPATSPALVRGASGGALPVPDYPLFVFSKAPANPKQEFGSGPYALKAESREDASAAAATVGADGGEQAALGLSKVRAKVESTADAITSSATSEIAAVAVGPLRIGRVFSTATAKFDRSGLQRTADTVLEGVSVDGNGAVVTSDGPPDLAGLNEALSGANITVELLPAREADTGIVAPAIQVTQSDGSGGAIVYKFGSASAFVDATLLPGSDDDSSSGAGTTTGSDSIGDAETDADAGTARTTTSRTIGGLSQRLAGSARPARPAPAGTTDATGTVVPVETPAAPMPQPSMVLASSAPDGVDTTSERAQLFFHRADLTPLLLILLAGAALAVGTLGLGRLRGARG